MAGALVSLAAVVLPADASWTVEDRVAVGVAATADMREVAGAGGTPRGAVKSEAHWSTLCLLAGRVSTRAVALVVVRARADRTVWLS